MPVVMRFRVEQWVRKQEGKDPSLIATLTQIRSRLFGGWQGAGMLSRLSGGSLLLLGAVAIAGMGLIAFASGQSWPTALGGGGSTPQQLIGLERPGAGVHQGVAANHALRALGGPVGRVSGAPAVAGG